MVSFLPITFGSYKPSVVVLLPDGTTAEPIRSSYKKEDYIDNTVKTTPANPIDKISIKSVDELMEEAKKASGALTYNQPIPGGGTGSETAGDTANAQSKNTESENAEATQAEEPNIGIFNNDDGNNPFIGLSALLGLDGYYSDSASLLESLGTVIQKESNELTKLLDSAIAEAKLSDVKKKLTFAEDADGNIVVEGNISASKRKKLAAIINDDPELVERIKTQKARMEIAEGLASNDTNFSKSKYDDARTQLLKNVLKDSGTSLEEFGKVRNELFKDGKLVKDDEINAKYESLTKLFTVSPELLSEFDAYNKRQSAPTADDIQKPGISLEMEERIGDADTTRSLLAMKRGTLSEATDEKRDFDGELADLRKFIMDGIVAEYNKRDEVLANPDLHILGFTMRFDDQGEMRITDVVTAGEGNDSAKGAENFLNGQLGSGTGKELGLAILDDHDDYHGDTLEYEHEVISGMNGGYKIESPDADKAALQEMDVLTQEIGAALGSFFYNTIKIKNPMSLKFDDGKLSMLNGESLTSMEHQSVSQVLKGINSYLKAAEKGEESEGMLSPKLTVIADKLIQLQEVQDKVHDKSKLPQNGIQFDFGR